MASNVKSLQHCGHRTKSAQTSLLYQFAKESTLHGIRGIITSPTNPLKAFWIVITLGCTCICFYQIIAALRQYVDRPTSINADITSLAELPLTAICPLKWFDSANAKQLGLTLNALYYLWNMVPWVAQDAFVGYQIGAVSNFSNNLNPEEGMRIVKSLLIEKNLSIYELIYRASVNLATFECEHCADGYPVKVMTPAGLCFVAKFANTAVHRSLWVYYNAPRAAIGFDRLHGAQFDYIAQSIYGSDIGSVSRNEPYALYNSTLVKYKFLFQVFTRQRGSEYTDFSPDENHYRCCEDCMQQVTYTAYGTNCTWLGFGLISDRLKNNISTPCGYEHWPKFLSKVGAPGNSNYPLSITACMTKCKQPRKTITITSMPLLDPLKDDKVLTDKFAAYVSVNYNFHAAANTLHIEEVPKYTWDTFIANLGGILGLWLGASIMSVFQLFYFCALAILNRAKSRGSAVVDDVIRVNVSPV